MNTKTIIVAAVFIAATAALAIAPYISLNAMAEQPRECFHKGTGEQIPCEDRRGNNAIDCNRGGNQCR